MKVNAIAMLSFLLWSCP